MPLRLRFFAPLRKDNSRIKLSCYKKNKTPATDEWAEVFNQRINESRLHRRFQLFAVVLRVAFRVPVLAVNLEGVVKQELVVINVFVAQCALHSIHLAFFRGLGCAGGIKRVSHVQFRMAYTI